MTRALVSLAVALAASAGMTHRAASAQAAGGPEGPQLRTASARDSAPIDLTGTWVSYVTENWRYRMVTPPKGEYRRIPSSPAALPLINGWDPVADEKAGNQCRSYGAAAIMNVPGRVRVTWQDANTLRLEADAGTQTRVFRFAPAKTRAGTKATWQGESTARWERGAAGGGSLRVVTTNMRAGYLRKNGVPYSEKATVTEHFDVAPLPGGGQLLLVTTVVEDPVYLTGPLVTSPHFKKEPDGSKWDPTPCSSAW